MKDKIIYILMGFIIGGLVTMYAWGFDSPEKAAERAIYKVLNQEISKQSNDALMQVINERGLCEILP